MIQHALCSIYLAPLQQDRCKLNKQEILMLLRLNCMIFISRLIVVEAESVAQEAEWAARTSSFQHDADASADAAQRLQADQADRIQALEQVEVSCGENYAP